MLDLQFTASRCVKRRQEARRNSRLIVDVGQVSDDGARRTTNELWRLAAINDGERKLLGIAVPRIVFSLASDLIVCLLSVAAGRNRE